MLQIPMKFLSTINIKKMNSKTIFNLMTYDKKNKDGKIQFVLIKDFGEILVDAVRR